jgi:hypothetical protein
VNVYAAVRVMFVSRRSTSKPRPCGTAWIVVAGQDGRWVYRSYLAKLDLAAAALTPEATIVKILETGRVGGRFITSMSDTERVILQSSSSGKQWTATIPGQSLVWELWSRGTEGIAGSDQRSRMAAALIAAALLLLVLYFLGPALCRGKTQNPRRPSLCANLRKSKKHALGHQTRNP